MWYPDSSITVQLVHHTEPENTVKLRIKPDTPLRKLMEKYCEVKVSIFSLK